jgi:hypothetical protein
VVSSSWKLTNSVCLILFQTYDRLICTIPLLPVITSLLFAYSYNFKIFVSYLQIGSTLMSQAEISWPTTYAQFLQYFDFLNLDCKLQSFFSFVFALSLIFALCLACCIVLVRNAAFTFISHDHLIVALVCSHGARFNV